MDFTPVYGQATVLFPEFFSDGGTDINNFKEEGEIGPEGNVNLRWGDFGVEVRRTNHAPGVLLEDSSLVSKIEQRILRPIREEVILDLESVRDIIEGLRELNRDGRKFQDNMYFTMGPPNIDNHYSFADYSHFENPKPVDVLLSFKDLPKLELVQRDEIGRRLDPLKIEPNYEGTRFLEYRALAQFIEKHGEDSVADFKGNTLREAMKRAVEVYNLAEELRDFSFTKY